MTWRYVQSTGELFHDAELIGTGYSGHGAGVNNPAMQSVKNVGPIPVGHYTIGPAFHHPVCGPVAMRLLPHPDNRMFNRDGLLMHGDTPSMDHTASDGCIIQQRQIRDRVDASPDRDLVVEAGPVKAAAAA